MKVKTLFRLCAGQLLDSYYLTKVFFTCRQGNERSLMKPLKAPHNCD